MLAWIASHQQVLSVLINFSMLVVWLAYLQIFVIGYIRQRRPNILINRGGGSTLEARCLISNMSAEAIYVASIIATLEIDGGRWSDPITDGELPDRWREDQAPNITRQGPLSSGDYRDIGHFQGFVERVAERTGAPSVLQRGEPFTLELLIVAYYASEYLPVGARRRFVISRDGPTWKLAAQSVGTKQVRSRRDRKRIEQGLREDL